MRYGQPSSLKKILRGRGAVWVEAKKPKGPNQCHPDICKSDSLKTPIAFPIVIKSDKLIGNSCLWVFSMVRLLNLVCVLSDRSARSLIQCLSRTSIMVHLVTIL